MTMATAVRAALYLRVSTGRQADSDLSIPDQRRQAKAYCASRGWESNDGSAAQLFLDGEITESKFNSSPDEAVARLWLALNKPA
ncbi:hypothetical protein [Bradyrhizobium campsiandrae]|uniref:hypothetical protein n=1 Tax=Bradyrhizobium campsiandrae TaxID=1729892 RepID=UPI0034D25BB7